ncbi:MAG: tRNA pseudouridine(38-40) synthase TruA [Hyphomonadaceae bacterium]|nr:tRNA pseudouridine(38-40) synthase TruA [Hyphomonadaceae bacterium]
MTRYRLTIEYDGRPFLGWQRQADGPSVQAALERAAEALDGAPVRVHGAGRTDTGVHALGQVAHMDLQTRREVDTVADALNYHLRPDPVAVLSVEEVTEDFHARFSATARHYRFIIVNRRADLTVSKGLAWRVAQPLDVEAMHAGAQHLVGHHDFTTFRDAQCQAKSPLRTLGAIAVRRVEDRVEIICSARAFLHRQVRSMVGSLVEVGRGRQEPGWIAEILAAADRSACGPVAPPDGLYLTAVDYDPPTDQFREG